MKNVATIILNRNLPEPTNKLYEHLLKYDKECTDLYVLEAGSDKDKLSQYVTWHALEDDIQEIGLRYSRGMNYALLKLLQEGKWEKYDYFFLLTNDTELSPEKTIYPLLKLLEFHKKLAIISPCSRKWGELLLLQKETTKYFWFIHNNAFMISRKFIDCIREEENPNYMNFLFDGSNFRGYLSESELIAKAYANDWAAAITSEVYAEENESYLLEKSDLIRTDNYKQNIDNYLKEGKAWLRSKYGFNSRWLMMQYVASFYNKFFDFNPEYSRYKI